MSIVRTCLTGGTEGHSQHKVFGFDRVSSRDFPVKCHPAASELATQPAWHVDADDAGVPGRDLDR
jgi:hypothetical protein